MSLGFGFVVGIIYDAFRLVRVCLSKGKRLQIVFDVIFCVFLAFITFLFFMSVNEGEFRIYLLLGEAVGFSVYSLSIGIVVFTYGELWIDWLKTYFSKFLHMVFSPFKRLLKRIFSSIGKLMKKFKKRDKNIENKSKIHLKLNKHLLYNLFIKKQNPVDKDFNEKDV
jgi:spore cortex biosynthesis protein YabQ